MGRRETYIVTRSVPDDLLAEISAAYERDPRINVHRWPISVWAEGGRVALDGRVEDIAAKRAAVNTARRLTEDRWPVLDLLRVDGEPIEDLALRDRVADALMGEPVFREHTLTVEAHDRVDTLHDAGASLHAIHARIHEGTVALAGRVGSLTHWRLAEVLMWWIAGCQRVDNRLEVVPPEEDNDNELTDAVRMALEKDPLVHADQFRVGTAGGVIELDGSVPSEEERRLAVRDAWCVPGVWDVVERVEVRAARPGAR